jgi:hypothetical protein
MALPKTRSNWLLPMPRSKSNKVKRISPQPKPSTLRMRKTQVSSQFSKNSQLKKRKRRHLPKMTFGEKKRSKICLFSKTITEKDLTLRQCSSRKSAQKTFISVRRLKRYQETTNMKKRFVFWLLK